jgi:methionyl-tRNA formyltransferase
MDSGPIYAQQAVKLSGQETKQQLADTLDELGKDLILGSIEDILEGRLKPNAQSSDGATYDKLITKEDGVINWQDPWAKIERMIRAYSIWPKTRSNISGVDITVLQAHYQDQQGNPGQHGEHEGSLAVYCQDGLVVIDQLIPAGSRPMSGKDFLLGYAKQLSN